MANPRWYFVTQRSFALGISALLVSCVVPKFSEVESFGLGGAAGNAGSSGANSFAGNGSTASGGVAGSSVATGQGGTSTGIAGNATSNGGTTAPSISGGGGVGGQTLPGIGGTTSLGGATVSGGTSPGGAANGGTSTNGGIPSNGGATIQGGAAGAAAGGTIAMGGVVGGGGAGVGGKPGTGGAATGGTSTGGATTSTGGAATGGATTSTGGAATGGATTSTGGAASCPRFSFFVTSLAAMRRLSGSTSGFGGDLRYGQVDGLAGADRICMEIAAASLACASAKTWRAFLSTSTVDAVDRIGSGPWYDRLGRPIGNTKTDLLSTRPSQADPAIKLDFPDENGTALGDGDGNSSTANDNTAPVLTGSGTNGRKLGTDTATSRCNEWTSTTVTGTPTYGHCWSTGPAAHWISSAKAEGCVAGVNVTAGEGAAPGTVASNGGYGAIYCFALSQ